MRAFSASDGLLPGIVLKRFLLFQKSSPSSHTLDDRSHS
jgi:hypothetical protein